MKHVPPSHLRIVSSNPSATQEQRDAMTFDPIDVKFNWSNDKWALAHLPHVRLATILLSQDHIDLQERFGAMAAEGYGPEMLEGLTTTRDHLLALAEICDVALTRCFLVVERMGYSPDNPPPDHTQH
ncbi:MULTISPECIES: hypothetical protein [Bradyrhizobium]|jgi:hypothetical protein|uniref:hypothetical protein n=1 Tax=Bradyrhizobium TaxID=374 RepID=UPI0012BB9477|nr:MULTISPECIES: hypothetical protein [Bradyrhizobium]MCS3450270.1 hypothetical protein [Bradyrhizobium elkanii]MCS3558584.1 hypothetical protein [Bradyrhizobium elkanii]MCW2151568.1 hypothetical protein [Bradyrhizobium elkanii]MCW2358558.1 hypothetical protein [Bradyrhizobium elkanii]MCW2375299.1 hypothetical protein [Bradyrhizobium elkanii]